MQPCVPRSAPGGPLPSRPVIRVASGGRWAPGAAPLAGPAPMKTSPPCAAREPTRCRSPRLARIPARRSPDRLLRPCRLLGIFAHAEAPDSHDRPATAGCAPAAAGVRVPADAGRVPGAGESGPGAGLRARRAEPARRPVLARWCRTTTRSRCGRRCHGSGTTARRWCSSAAGTTTTEAGAGWSGPSRGGRARRCWWRWAGT